MRRETKRTCRSECVVLAKRDDERRTLAESEFAPGFQLNERTSSQPHRQRLGNGAFRIVRKPIPPV